MVGSGDELSAEQQFGQKVSDTRANRGWTQDEVRRRLAAFDVDLSSSGMSRLESGRRPIRLNEAVALARVLDIDLRPLVDLAAPDSTITVESLVARVLDAKTDLVQAQRELEVLKVSARDSDAHLSSAMDHHQQILAEVDAARSRVERFAFDLNAAEAAFRRAEVGGLLPPTSDSRKEGIDEQHQEEA